MAHGGDELRPAGRLWQALRRNADWLLIAATLALFATDTLFNLPLVIMAIASLVMLGRGRWRLGDSLAARVLLLVFAAFWLPMLAATLDAVNVERSLRTTLGFLRFPLAGLFVCFTLADPRKLEKLGLTTFVVVCAWSADGIIQLLAGRNLLGYPHDRLQVSGVFHPNLLLGIVTATVLAPCAAVALEARRRPWLWALAASTLPIAILISSNRNSWFLAVVVVLALGLTLALRGARRQAAGLLAAIPAAGVLAAVLVAAHPPLQGRMAESLGALAGDAEHFDAVSGYRLTLWRTALEMLQRNPVNGIGPRGYRYAYPDYALPGDFWMERFGRGQTHPHQQVLEIGAETGVPGLAGYAAAWAILLWLYRRALGAASLLPSAWVIAAGIAMFPLNAHKAIYSSYWAAILWWLLAIATAAACRPGAGAAAQNSQGASWARRSS